MGICGSKKLDRYVYLDKQTNTLHQKGCKLGEMHASRLLVLKNSGLKKQCKAKSMIICDFCHPTLGR